METLLLLAREQITPLVLGAAGQPRLITSHVGYQSAPLTLLLPKPLIMLPTPHLCRQ